jgi:hypothetical protein
LMLFCISTRRFITSPLRARCNHEQHFRSTNPRLGNDA